MQRPILSFFKHFIISIPFIISFITISFSSNVFAENTEKQQTIKIGLLPYLSPDLLMSRYAPFIEYVGQQLHLKPIPETAPNFPDYCEKSSKLRI